MKTALRLIALGLLSTTLGYGQLGAAVGGFNDAQERDLERKHQLQMQREAEQTALEIARLQAQARAAAQPSVEAVAFWQSGNEFVRGCAAGLEKATLTDSEAANVVACTYWFHGKVLESTPGVDCSFPAHPCGNRQ